jgi:hypothetical protein
MLLVIMMSGRARKSITIMVSLVMKLLSRMFFASSMMRKGDVEEDEGEEEQVQAGSNTQSQEREPSRNLDSSNY